MTTVTEVSRSLGVSTRMLRYYEQQGLIRSSRRADYAYRVYDEENVSRLRIILVLRKLRVPLAAIAEILSDCDAGQAIAVLQARVQEVEDELRSLEAIRDMLTIFIERIGGAADAARRIALLGEEGVMAAVRALGLSNTTLKERTLMDEMQKTEQAQWKSLNVRLVQLPPRTVACFHYIGVACEDHAGDMAKDFILGSGLYQHKPDSRMFGFNHPSPTPEQPVYGYEYQITIPDDMDVPAPGVKRTVPGGLYAAHTMTFPNFHEWQWLVDWVNNSPDYCADFSEAGDEVMGGCYEEHLNWVYVITQEQAADNLPAGALTRKLDLLLPVKKRN